ncbi:MAG: DUF4031 domain-containing protein [Bacteroidetes bacterium]|nr:DUF4031 domain-containing protein [Bacteroidota bacterium]
MAVYVDRPKPIFFRGRQRVFVHMVADSLEELLAFADALDIPRRAFQDKPRRPHYDIFDEYIEVVKAAGAVQIGNKELVQVLRRQYGS